MLTPQSFASDRRISQCPYHHHHHHSRCSRNSETAVVLFRVFHARSAAQRREQRRRAEARFATTLQACGAASQRLCACTHLCARPLDVRRGRIHFHLTTISSKKSHVGQSWKRHRPKADDSSHEGLLKPERREFRCLGA